MFSTRSAARRRQPGRRPGRLWDVTTMDLPLGTIRGRSRARAAGAEDETGVEGPNTGSFAVPRSADEAVGVLYTTHWFQLVRLATLLTSRPSGTGTPDSRRVSRAVLLSRATRRASGPLPVYSTPIDSRITGTGIS